MELSTDITIGSIVKKTEPLEGEGVSGEYSVYIELHNQDGKLIARHDMKPSAAKKIANGNPSIPTTSKKVMVQSGRARAGTIISAICKTTHPSKM